jgi:hypothetical protein
LKLWPETVRVAERFFARRPWLPQREHLRFTLFIRHLGTLVTSVHSDDQQVIVEFNDHPQHVTVGISSNHPPAAV